MGNCLSITPNEPQVSKQNQTQYRYHVVPNIENQLKPTCRFKTEFSNPITIQPFKSCNNHYDKLTWHEGTPIQAPVNNQISRCVVLRMKMGHEKPDLNDDIQVKFPDGRITEYKRRQLQSYPSYRDNLRKLCPGCTIEIRYKSQWIPCYIYEWGDATNKTQFQVMFEREKKMEMKQIQRYWKKIRCSETLLKLSENSDIFVFDADIGEWCYGKIKSVFIKSEDKNNKWLDLDIYEVYYRKNGNIYRKYVNQFSASIALMESNLVNEKCAIKDEDIKDTTIHSDVTDLRLFVKEKMDCQEICDDILYIIDRYIDFNYGYIMEIESQTYSLAINKRNTNLKPSDSTIHNGMNTIQIDTNETLPYDEKKEDDKNKISKHKKSTDKNNPYKSSIVKDIQKRIKIPPKLQAYASEHIIENISNIYYYMLNINALQYTKEMNQNNKVKVFNYNFHDKQSNEILYGIATLSNLRRFEWCMENKLFCRQEILSNIKWNVKVSLLPQFDNALFFLVSDFEMQCILKSVMRDKIFKETLERIKWKNIKVYHGITDKNNRFVWKVTQEQFEKQIIEFYENDKDISLIPILIMNNKPQIEFLYIIKIPKNGICINIGISFQWMNGTLTIGGIHLNKDYIIHQCELADPNCDYKYIDSDGWIIDELQIGNPDDDKNKLKAKDKVLKERNETIKKLKDEKNI